MERAMKNYTAKKSVRKRPGPYSKTRKEPSLSLDVNARNRFGLKTCSVVLSRLDERHGNGMLDGHGDCIEIKKEVEEDFHDTEDTMDYAYEPCAYEEDTKLTVQPSSQWGDDLSLPADLPFECDVCPQRFPFRAYLLVHQFSEHHPRVEGTNARICGLCDYKSKHKNHFTEHLLTHTKEKPFKCVKENCELRFFRQSVLAAHVRSAHRRETTTKLPVLEVDTVVNVESLKIRQELEKTEGCRFSCSLCEESFKFKSYLLAHERTKHRSKRSGSRKRHRMSDDDESGVYEDEDAAVHLTVETLNQPSEEVLPAPTEKSAFECDVCQQRFPFRAYLLVHQFSEHHSRPEGINALICGLCQYETTCKGSNNGKTAFIRHMFTHTKERPYRCPEESCGYRYYRRQLIVSHCKNIHNREFNENSDTTVIPDVGIIGVRMNLIKKLKNVEVHEFPCSYCEESFPFKAVLLSHEYIKHRPKRPGFKKGKCEICEFETDRKNDLDGHMFKHTKELRLKCPVEGCSYGCFKKNLMALHLKRCRKNTSESCVDIGPDDDTMDSDSGGGDVVSDFDMHLTSPTDDHNESVPKNENAGGIPESHSKTLNVSRRSKRIQIRRNSESPLNRNQSSSAVKHGKSFKCPEKDCLFAHAKMSVINNHVRYFHKMKRHLQAPKAKVKRAVVSSDIVSSNSEWYEELRPALMFQCEHPGCDSSFGFQALLLYHNEICHNHGRNKTFKGVDELDCSKCDKRVQVRHFLDHFFTHTEELRYKCLRAGCEHRTTTLSNMYRHDECCKGERVIVINRNASKPPPPKPVRAKKEERTCKRPRLEFEFWNCDYPECKWPGSRFKALVIAHKAVDHFDMTQVDKTALSPDDIHKVQMTCTLCTYQAKHSRALREHYFEHTGEPLLQCENPGCTFKTWSSSGLSDHKTHQRCGKVRCRLRQPRKAVCKICNKIVSANRISAHYKKEHLKEQVRETLPYPCTMCSVKNRTRCELRVHMKKVHDTDLTADMCPRRFLKFKNVERVQPTRVYNCEKCNMVFDFRTFLIVHEMTDHSTEPFETNARGQEVYQCSSCSYKGTRTPFRNHLFIHTQEDRFRCGISGCDFVSYRSETVFRHIYSNHKEAKASYTRVCDLCGAAIQSQKLARHYRLVHGGDRRLERKRPVRSRNIL